MKLNTTTQQQLFIHAELKKLEEWTYLQDVTNENFAFIKGKFFPFDSDDKAKLLNVGSGVFETVTGTIASYVGNIDIEVGMNFDELVKDMMTIGFGVYSIERVNWKYSFVNQPAQNYVYEDGIDKMFRFYQNDKEYFMLVQEFGVWYIANTLYKIKSFDVIEWVEISLDSIPQTRGLQSLVRTNLPVPAIFTIYDGQPSVIEKIKPIVYALDRQIVMWHTQFLQNVDSFILMKNIILPQKQVQNYNEGKIINFNEIGRVVQGAEDNASIEFVNNVNSLIKDCFVENQNFVRRVSAITTISIDFFGLDTNDWAIGEGSRTLKQGTFIKRIQAIRDTIDKSLKISLAIIGITEQYKRPDIFAKSSQELADELATARSAKLISLYNAIKTYNNFTDEEAQKEYDLILSEKALWLNEWEKSTSPNSNKEWNNE